MRFVSPGRLTYNFLSFLIWLFMSVALFTTVAELKAQKLDIEKSVKQTEQYLQANDLTSALRCAHTAVQLFPMNTEAYLTRARVHERMNNPNAALTDLGLAIAVDPENPETRFMRGMLAYRMNRLDLARTDYRYLLSNKNSVTNTVFYRQNNFQGTDRIITMQSGPTDQLLHLLGLVEIKAENFKRAIELLDSAIKINKSEADLFAHRGLAFEKIGNDSLAARDFDQAFRLNPAHPIVMANRSKKGNKIHVDSKSDEDWLTSAIEGNPKSPEWYAERAMILFEKKEFERSVRDYDSAIRRDPGDPDLWFNRGMAFEKVGKQTEAFKSFGQAILLNDRYAKAWFMQGTLQLKKDDFKRAIESFTIAIGIDPIYAAAYQNRSIALHRSGLQQDACRDIKEAIRLGLQEAAQMKAKMCK